MEGIYHFKVVAYNIFSRILFYSTAEIVLGNCEYVIPKDGDPQTPFCKGMFEITELLIIFYIIETLFQNR